MIELHPYQEIFMLFFAILYGAMLYSCNRFNPFPFISLNSLNIREKKILKKLRIGKGDYSKLRQDFCDCRKRRIVVSIVFLNVIPFLYFLIIFHYFLVWLDSFFGSANPKMILISMFFALSIFSCFRLYRMLVVLRKKPFFCDLWFICEEKFLLKFLSCKKIKYKIPTDSNGATKDFLYDFLDDFTDNTDDWQLDFFACLFYLCLPWIVALFVSCNIWGFFVSILAIFLFIFVFRDC